MDMNVLFVLVVGAKENVLMHLPTLMIAGPTLPVEIAVLKTWMTTGLSVKTTWIKIMKTFADTPQK